MSRGCEKQAVAEEQEQFEDPALKAAVCRAWGAECCPEAVRRGVLAAVNPPPTQPVQLRRPIVFPFRPVLGLATAALVVIAATLAWQQWPAGSTTSSNPSFAPNNPTQSSVELPASLVSDLTFQHDRCAANLVHRDPDLAQDDPVELARQMQKVLNFPVLTERLPKEWNFRGAAFCPVGTCKSAHLIYFRVVGPRKTVSVFSLPADVWPGGQGHTCAEVDPRSRHPLAGFATGRGVYFMVGSAHPPMTLAEVRDLMSRLQTEMADDPHPPAPARMTIVNGR